jgi:hypothetical protein
MKKQHYLYVAGGIVAVIAALYLIKTPVTTVTAGSSLANWIAKHPTSKNTAGVATAPILIKLISK